MMYDLKTVYGKGSVGTQLLDSIGQSNRILLNITSDYNGRLLAADIKAYFEANRNAVEVLLFKGKKTISVNRYAAQSPMFYRQFFDERSDKSITARNTSNKKAAPYMMQPFIQMEQYL